MDFRTTSTNIRRWHRSGFTLLETVFTVGITTMCLATLGTFFLFSTHSFCTLFNYVDLDDANRIAMDQLTRDVRQANSVSSYTTNGITMQTSEGWLSYAYDSHDRTLTRTKQDGTSTVVLKECDRLSFIIGQRNPVNGSYDVYPAASPATAKVVNVSWMCSR